MRKKIKELLHKEEGFTLVELLAVIVILGIVVAIAIPAIGNVINESQTKANTVEVELVEDAARLYYSANKEGDADYIPVTEMTVEKLITAGYLDVEKASDVVVGSFSVVNNNIVYTTTK